MSDAQSFCAVLNLSFLLNYVFQMNQSSKTHLHVVFQSEEPAVKTQHENIFPSLVLAQVLL